MNTDAVTTADPWNVTPAEARAVQHRLAAQVAIGGEPRDVRLVAGLDISTGPRGSNAGRAAVVLVRWPELDAVEQATFEAQITFPYVPGLLSFRELPLLLPALERLSRRPDLLVVDGQGIAHPRRFGIAAHLGVLLDLPAIGCAKSPLSGRPVAPLGDERGARVALLDRGELVGHELRSKDRTKPLYISPGHRIGHEEAVEWILRLGKGYRLPEPTRLAHLAAAGKRVAP